MRFAVESISHAFAVAAGTAGPEKTEQQMAAVLKTVKRIASDLSFYPHSDEDSRLGLEACVMVPYTDEEVRKKGWAVEFAENGHQYPGYLRLEYTTKAHANIVVPFELKSDHDRLLPGAPEAFVLKEPVIINDTSRLRFRGNTPTRSTDAMKNYLARQEFNSFASFPILHGENVVGVLNIDARPTDVFGRTGTERAELGRFLLPLTTCLGLILARIRPGDGPKWQAIMGGGDIPVTIGREPIDRE
jgi:hypothetical protein